MSRKALASSVASKLALTALLERAGSRRPALVVLIYHRILDPKESLYDPHVIEATPDQFDDQMSMLRRRHAFVDPEELRELVERPSKVKHLRVAITFDDGYRDNYTSAFPILRSHGLSAFFFVPTAFVGTGHVPWWDQVAWAVRNTPRSELTLEYPKRLTVKVDRSAPRAAIYAVLSSFTHAGDADQKRFLAAVEKACEVELPRAADPPQFFSWEEAEEMQRGGMAIASHTHSHRILAGLGDGEQKDECRESHDQLEQRSFGFSDCLAYPVGHLSSFSKATIDHAREAGYRFAFSNYGGLNTPERMDPFDIKRIAMDLDQDARQLRLRLALAGVAQRDFW